MGVIMMDKNFTEVYRDGVNGDICMGVDLEEDDLGVMDRLFLIEDKSCHRKVAMTGQEARQLAIEILCRTSGKIPQDDTLLGFAMYGQTGGGEVYYKAILPDGRYAELHVFETPDGDWLEGAPVLKEEDLS